MTCIDSTDENFCEDGLYFLSKPKPPPALISFTPFGIFNTLPLEPSDFEENSTLCPITHFECLVHSYYCLPVYLRCNGVYDCPDREDEADCESYTCPGYYRCLDSKICVHPHHVCDGVYLCPQRDDDLLCSVTFPEN